MKARVQVKRSVLVLEGGVTHSHVTSEIIT